MLRGSSGSGAFSKCAHLAFFVKAKNGRYWRRLCRDCFVGGGMAHFYRLAISVFALLLAFSSVYAQTCTGRYSVRSAVADSNAPPVYGSSASSACSAAGGSIGEYSWVGTVSVGGGGCDITITVNGVFSGVAYHQFLEVPSCTGGGSSGTNNCKSGSSAGRWSLPLGAGQSASANRFICDGESPSGNSDGSVCVVKVVPTLAVGGQVYGDGVFTGAARKMADCTGTGGTGGTSDAPLSGNQTPAVEGEPAPTPCKAGEAPGSVNGVSKCYPAGASGEPVTTTTKTETTTPSPVEGAQPDTAGQIGETQCVGSQCTTTTTTTKTTTGPNGVATTTTGTSTKTESKGDYCAANPNSEQCKTGSFGGSCAAAFSCDGDAVMCAIALDQHKRNCTLFETPSTESALYDTEKSKTGTQAKNEAKAISSSSFNTSDAIGAGGGCIANKTVTVMGRSFTLPFSNVCPSLALLGNVLLVVSFLLAGRIVVRG